MFPLSLCGFSCKHTRARPPAQLLCLCLSLQLEVLTNLANETNIPTVLREFQVQPRGSREGVGSTLVFRAPGCRKFLPMIAHFLPVLRTICLVAWGFSPCPSGGSPASGVQRLPKGRFGGCRTTESSLSAGAYSVMVSPQTYIRSMDKDFVAATIQAIGRCATNIGRVRDTCLNGLVQLLSNRDGRCLPVRGTVPCHERVSACPRDCPL